MIPEFGTQEHKANIHRVLSFDYDPRSRTKAVARFECGAFSDRALPVDELDIGIRLCLKCFDPDLYQHQQRAQQIAHALTTKAIKQGLIHPPLFCSVCLDCPNRRFVGSGKPMVEAHHDDYSKPIHVRWLCQGCHKSWHRENQPLYPPFIREVAA